MMKTPNTNRMGPLIGRAIARERQKAGLTQAELAEKLDIGNEAVSRIERGLVLPSLPRLIELAEVLGCETATLIGENSLATSDQTGQILRELQQLSPRDRGLVLALIKEMRSGPLMG